MLDYLEVLVMDSNILYIIGLLAIVWYVVTSILIYEYLRKKEVKVSFLFLRFLIPKYAGQYKKITKTETGKVGTLFYQWIISINIALVVAILLFLGV